MDDESVDVICNVILIMSHNRVYSYLNDTSRISRGLIIDAGAINFLDATGTHTIEEITRTFADRGLLILFANSNRKVIVVSIDALTLLAMPLIDHIITHYNHYDNNHDINICCINLLSSVYVYRYC
jgi:MFS superfamily sulfate permease-like transporter